MTKSNTTPAPKRKRKVVTPAKKRVITTPATFTTVDVALAHGIKRKTLRQSVRKGKHRDAYAKLAVDAVKSLHTFPNKNRKAFEALMAQA